MGGWDYNTTKAALKELVEDCKGIEEFLAEANIHEGYTNDYLYVDATIVAPGTVEHGAIKWLFYMQELPGCCGVVVSCRQYIREALRGQGLGKRLQILKEAITRKLKYGLMICTVTADNVAQIKVLTATGWHQIDSFVNPKTQHKVLLFSKHTD